MLVSIVLNSILGQYLKYNLSQKSYALTVDVDYPIDGSMELHYDTGKGFNQKQEVAINVKKDNESVHFPFSLERGQQLKFLRLDFGSNSSLKSVELNSIALSTMDKVLFNISKTRIKQDIVFLNHIKEIDRSLALVQFDTSKAPFDPYLVLKPLNELVYPSWFRTVSLILPWIVLFAFPLISWLNRLRYKKEYILIFTALFIVAIPLKIAWVTFSTLLLLAYGLFNYYVKRKIQINLIQISVSMFFVIPLLLIGDGDFVKLAIPMGFLLFPLITGFIDFSDLFHSIKKIYINVFHGVSSILIVSWLVLILYYGYYYNIDIYNYFSDIKTNAHASIFWLFYDHTTFLSFFILIGGVFCYDLYHNKRISKRYASIYFLFSLCAIVLLGSRFALVLLLVLPVLLTLSAKNISRWILPSFALIFAAIVYFISSLDDSRTQLWKMSWEAIQEKPWLGFGTGTSEAILQDLELAQRAGFNDVLQMNHSHNQFLTYLLENGILGLSLFMGVFVFIVFRYTKQDNKIMVLICLLILLLMIIESPFRTATPLYLISFLLTVFSKNKRVDIQKNSI